MQPQPFIRVDSYPLLGLLLPGFGVYLYVLVQEVAHEPVGVVNVIYVILGAVYLFYLWISTYSYDINPDKVVIRRLFGLLPQDIRKNSSISIFRQRPNYSGRISVFEIKYSSGNVVTLHHFHRNFHAAVVALELANPNVATQQLSKWGF